MFAGQPLTFIQVSAVALGLFGVSTIGLAGGTVKKTPVVKEEEQNNSNKEAI